MHIIISRKTLFSLRCRKKRCTSCIVTDFFMQHGNNIRFFICLVSFCLFSCHYRWVLCSYLYVRVCVSVCETHSDCSVLSDGKLRIHCTKEKHRSAEAQAGVKPINNQMHLVVWSLVERTCCGTQVALIFCFQATMRTMTGFYADRFYGNPELQSCFCK